MWNSFIEDFPYHATHKVGVDGIGTLSLIPQYDYMPPGFSLELGEFLYQLRAALDGSIYAYAIASEKQDPPSNPGHLEFVVRSTKKEFESCFNRQLSPLSAAAREFLDALQPYNMPALEKHLRVFNFNRALDILNDWARLDRHRKLHVLGTWPSNTDPAVNLCRECRIKNLEVLNNGIIEGDCEIARFELEGYEPGMKVSFNLKCVLDIAVDEEPRPCADNDILAIRLEAMIRATQFVVNGLEGIAQAELHPTK